MRVQISPGAFFMYDYNSTVYAPYNLTAEYDSSRYIPGNNLEYIPEKEISRTYSCKNGHRTTNLSPYCGVCGEKIIYRYFPICKTCSRELRTKYCDICGKGEWEGIDNRKELSASARLKDVREYLKDYCRGSGKGIVILLICLCMTTLVLALLFNMAMVILSYGFVLTYICILCIVQSDNNETIDMIKSIL